MVTAIRQTIYHAAGDRSFNALTTRWIQMAPADVRAQHPGKLVNEFLTPAIEAIRESLLPGLQGLEYIARHEENGRAISELVRAQTNVTSYLNELAEVSSSLDHNPLGMDGIQRVEGLWARIRECTQFGPPQAYLARPPMPGDAVGTLERWMPEFFCLPEDVAREMTRFLPNAKVTANWQRGSMGISAVLVRTPLADVREMLELLFADSRRHGVGTIAVDFVRSFADSRGRLEMSVTNAVSPERNRGTGRSQGLVKDVAGRNQLGIFFPRATTAGESYRVRLVFPEAYDI